MSQQLTQEQKDIIRTIFIRLDSYKDGRVDCKDVATMLRAMGQNPTNLELEIIGETCDHKYGPTMDYDEMVATIEEVGLLSHEEVQEELRLAFRAIDRDNSGTISREELRLYMAIVDGERGEAEADELFGMCDLNHNGIIDYEEFVAVLAAAVM